MTFPKQSDVEIPLLRALMAAGGQARPRDLYPVVANSFPDLSDEDQEVRLESSPSTRKWANLVQWARQKLIEAGDVDGGTRGVWKITPQGAARVDAGGRRVPVQTPPKPTGEAASEATLRDLANASRDEVRSRLLSELKNLSATAFEKFCTILLQELGFANVEVTQRSRDGGIDGFGSFRQGAVRINSAFQAKRWTDGPVGRPEIDKLRGAIQGDYDHGVFITTSRFTKDAQEASYKKGAISVLLLDGPAVVDLMIERGIGVNRQPLYLYDVDAEFFQLEEE
jgi:restriction system protein